MNCLFEGCTREDIIVKHSLCQGHYGQQWRGNALTYLPPLEPKGVCHVEGCSNRAKTQGACSTCYTRMRTFKVDGEFLADMQKATCAICHSSERLVIDHDHTCCPDKASNKGVTCGKCVRGILCNNCNAFLGYAKHSTALLESMIGYLTTHTEAL